MRQQEPGLDEVATPDAPRVGDEPVQPLEAGLPDPPWGNGERAGEEFEQIMLTMGARFLRPDRKDEPRRYGSQGAIRQWIESVFWTCKGQLTLEAHGGRTIEGLCTRVALRLLALAAGLVHNQTIGNPGRHFAAYGY